MAVNARESVIQGVRLFVISATGLAAGKVLVEPPAGPRPAVPYVTVRAIMLGAAVGTDERRYDLGGTGGAQREWIRGHRRATVQLACYGTEAADHLEIIRMAAENPTKRATTTTTTYAVSIARVLTPRNAMVQRDTSFAERMTMDIEVAYRLETAPATIVTADHLHFDLTLLGTHPPTLPADLAFDLTQDT